MNKKRLGGIAALSLAAITAVPTFSIVASADFSYSLTSVWQAPTGYGADGKPTGYKYYDSKANADKAIEALVTAQGGSDGKIEINTGSTDDDGNPIKITVKPASASVDPTYAVKKGGKYNVDPDTGEITESASGQYTYEGGSSSSTTTPGTNQPPENPPSNGTTTTPGDYNATYTSTYRYYSSATGRFYSTYDDAVAAGGRVDICTRSSSTTYSSAYPYYYNGRYYQTWADAWISSGYNASYVGNYTNGYIYDKSHSGSTTYPYYSSYTTCWYKTWSDAVADTQYSFPSLSYSSVTAAISNRYTDDYSTTYSSTYSWYSSYTKRYYRTYADALAVSPNASYVTQVDASSSTTYSSSYTWYSSYTRRYYQTYSAALAASNNNASYVRQVTSNAYTDPYYYYYYGLGYTTTTTTKDTSTVTIGNSKGWTSVIRTINSARSGASYTVNMKTETEIPSNVLTALKGKNVTINFKFSNGAIFTLNGNDISSTTAISPVIRYGSTSIPSSLKKKAVKANDGVSSSQFTINGSSFGASASVTVKFNTKRAGCTAKLYRYNAAANTLSLVSRSTVQSNGQCKFSDVKQGGEYIVVLS